MNNEIIYKVVEMKVLDLYEDYCVFNNKYCLEDKVEIENEKLEFINLLEEKLVYSYNVSNENDNEYYLIVVVESNELIYLILDEDYKEIESTIIDIDFIK